jgi:predicted site-specific integrase-resolvase
MMADTQRPTDMMTRPEAAQFLGVSLVTIDKWIRQGRLRRGSAVIENRLRSVVNAADVRRVKQERETVQWQDGEE